MIKKILKGNIFKSCLNTTKLGALYSSESKKHSTTILVVKKDKEIFMIGDGQVSQGYTVVKGDARKVRVLREGIICGFAGSVSDAFTLMENLEKELDKYHGFPLLKPCIELSKHWRSSKSQYFLIFGRHLRHLEATMIVCDNSNIIELDGAGNVLEIENVRGIGSGGLFAECAALALIDIDGWGAEDIGRKAMKIASDRCVMTNSNYVTKKLEFLDEENRNLDSE